MKKMQYSKQDARLHDGFRSGFLVSLSYKQHSLYALRNSFVGSKNETLMDCYIEKQKQHSDKYIGTTYLGIWVHGREITSKIGISTVFPDDVEKLTN